MDKKVLSAILLDETLAFLLVEPLYPSFWHNTNLLFSILLESRLSKSLIFRCPKIGVN
jgi:Utp8, C-terminal